MNETEMSPALGCEISNNLNKLGFYHFMELEERNDLMAISTSDPLALEPENTSQSAFNSLLADRNKIRSQIPLVDCEHVEEPSDVVTTVPECESEDLISSKDEITLTAESGESEENSSGKEQYSGGTDSIHTKVRLKTKTKNTSHYECSICRKRLSSKNTLILHQMRRHQIQVQLHCEVCEEQSTSNRDLIQHRKTHRRKEDDKFECGQCGKAVGAWQQFVAHHKTHRDKAEDVVRSHKNYQCASCGKRFPFQCLLRDHENTHTGSKPYLCHDCGKCFSSKSSLKQHSRIHSGVRRHKCTYCEFRGIVKADLLKHIRTHTKERPYMCEMCGEGYTQSSHLVVHRRGHLGYKPFTCDVCMRAFSKRGDMMRHRRIHTGELPYLCQVCGKAFRQSSQCSNHVKQHHPGTVNGSLNIPGYIPHPQELARV